MKNLLISLFLFGSVTQVTFADISNINDLDKRLSTVLIPKEKSTNLATIKKIASERNLDINIELENFIIAKQRVNVARAALNPLTTGTALGMALGLTYLWTPIAINAVISIPTKIYDISKNKSLAKAESYQTKVIKKTITNEIAHLYYDLVTHDALLKTIDEEMIVYNEYEDIIKTRLNAKEALPTINSLKIQLNISRLEIYKMYQAELQQFRTMLNIDANAESFTLAQVSESLPRNFLENLNKEYVKENAFINSDYYKVSWNTKKASGQNVSSVKWSILSLSGLNFSYLYRVRVAKNDALISSIKLEAAERITKNNALASIEKLKTSLDVSYGQRDLLNESIAQFQDAKVMESLGKATIDNVVEASINMIRDYRTAIATHYATLSALDDFSTNAEFEFSPSSDPKQTAENQLQKNAPYYGLTKNNVKFKLARNYFDSYYIELDTKFTNVIDYVEYDFESPFKRISGESANEKMNFRKYFSKIQFSGELKDVKGKATLHLKNGHELTINFNL